MSKKKIIILIVILIVGVIFIKYYYNSYINCAGQGEKISTFTGGNPAPDDICCKGLRMLDICNVQNKHEVFGIPCSTDVAICSDCGNNICDEVENYFTCPEDCK